MEEGPESPSDGGGLVPNTPAPVEPVVEAPLHADPPVEPAIPAAAPDVDHAPDSLPEVDASEKRFGCPRCYLSPNGCSTCRRPGYKPRNGNAKKSDPRPLQPKGPAAKAKAKAKAAAAKKKVIKAPGRHKKPGRAARVSSWDGPTTTCWTSIRSCSARKKLLAHDKNCQWELLGVIILNLVNFNFIMFIWVNPLKRSNLSKCWNLYMVCGFLGQGWMKWFMRQHCSVHVSALLVGLAVNKLSAEDWNQIEKLEPSAYEQTTLSKNCMLLRMELFKSRCDTCTHTMICAILRYPFGLEVCYNCILK